MRNGPFPALLALSVGACSTAPVTDDDRARALALIRQQATTDSYMTGNAFSYQVYAAADPIQPIDASRLRRETKGSPVMFVGDVAEEEARRLDLARMSILAPVPRSDGDYDVPFSYDTCLRSGGYYGWDSRAVMRQDATGW